MVAPEKVEVVNVFFNHTHLKVMSNDFPDYRVFRVEAVDEELWMSKPIRCFVTSISWLRGTLPSCRLSNASTL